MEFAPYANWEAIYLTFSWAMWAIAYGMVIEIYGEKKHEYK